MSLSEIEDHMRMFGVAKMLSHPNEQIFDISSLGFEY